MENQNVRNSPPLFCITESLKSEKSDVILTYRNRRCIRIVKVSVYLLQVFLYCGHIGPTVQSELATVPAAAEQRSGNEHIH